MTTKKKGTTVSLKGAAASAFVNMHKGEPPKTSQEQYEQLATLVSLHVQSNNMDLAVGLLKLLGQVGVCGLMNRIKTTTNSEPSCDPQDRR